MDRRTVLKLMAIASSSMVIPQTMSLSRVNVVIVGAGIIGAASAYYLSKAGAKVTIIDQQAPATHASRGTFAWLNATWAKQPKSYHHFNRVSLNMWRNLQNELNIPIRWNGSIEWFASNERNQKLAQQIVEQQEWGEPARMLNAQEIIDLEQNIQISSEVNVAFSPNDGAVDPVFATEQFLSAAIAHGAELKFPCKALETITKNGRNIGVQTTKGPLNADTLLICAGADDTSIKTLSGMSIPQRATPGVIAVTKPIKPIVNTIVAAPGVHLHQRADGVIVLGEQSGPPEGEAHKIRLQGRPNGFPAKALAIEHGERILKDATAFFPLLKSAQIDDAYIGWRPLPLDGHPVIGHSNEIDGTYLAISHSGVTLAPIIGKLVTHEILHNKPAVELSEYRPERSFSQVVRY